MNMRRDYENCIVTFDGVHVTFMTRTGRVLCVKKVYHEEMLYLPLLPENDEWARDYILKYMSDMFASLAVRVKPNGNLRQQLLDQGFRDVNDSDFTQYRLYYHPHCYMDVVIGMNNTATFILFVDEEAQYKYDCIEKEGHVYTHYSQLVDEIRTGYFAYALDVVFTCSKVNSIVDLHEQLTDENYQII